MGSKEICIHRLNQARIAHTQWVGNVKLLASGLLKKKSDMELNASKITFGKWFYEDAMLFRDTNCNSVICEIEMLWEEIHQQFMHIYEVCVSNQKKNIFGLEKPLSTSDKQLSSRYYEDLIGLSDAMKKSLRLFEKQLNAKAEGEFGLYESYLEAEKSDKSIEKEVDKKKEDEHKGVSGARGAYFTN